MDQNTFQHSHNILFNKNLCFTLIFIAAFLFKSGIFTAEFAAHKGEMHLY